jgi:hypothetical protein
MLAAMMKQFTEGKKANIDGGTGTIITATGINSLCSSHQIAKHAARCMFGTESNYIYGRKSVETY